MNNSNDTEATKHLAQTEEIAERWQTIKKLFESASALTGKEREKFLKKACGEDVELRLEVGKLLASFEDSDTFLEKLAAARANASLFFFRIKRLVFDSTSYSSKNN